MPILAQEPDIFPEELLDQAELNEDCNTVWRVAYTLPRREKDLMRRLRSMRIPHYGPLVARRTRSPAGRVRVSHVPLFPSYVFVYGDDRARYQAMTTNSVSRYIDVPDGRELTYDLAQIRRLIATGGPFTPEARLAVGMRVRVRSGPFAGTEGCIIRRDNQDRLLIAINFLKQGASVLLDDYQLERID